MGSPHVHIREWVPLAPLTTIGLGGPARRFAECRSTEEIAGGLDHARSHGWRLHLLGGGSNTVFADGGFDGVVLRIATRGISAARESGRVIVTVAAGEEWDAVVRFAIAEGLGGIECLSGIPGSAGAAPVQNIGAYGQEVSESMLRVEAIDCSTLRSISFTPKECGFGYRMSRFKSEDAGRFVITSVAFALTPNGRPELRYRELQGAVEESVDLHALPAGSPALASVREAVLSLRRKKGMVTDPADPHSRSCGSFFMNPILSENEVGALQERWRRLGGREPIPLFSAGGGTKVSAAWLVEHGGFPKGTMRGKVGVSAKHSLALVNYGGTTSELLDLAREIASAVSDRFGVRLDPEPVIVV